MEEVKKITGEIEISPTLVKDIKKEVKNIPDFKEKIEKSLTKKTSDLIELILAGAFFLEGSDVHLEREEEKAKFRLRVDGVLHDVLYFDLKLYKSLLSRIKLLSEIKLNVTSRPQDGRFFYFYRRRINRNQDLNLAFRIRRISRPQGFKP